MVGVSVAPHSYSAGPAPPPGRTPLFVYALTSMAVLGGFLFGYDCGVVAGAMVIIRKEWGDTVISDLWQELIISVTVGAAAIFSLVGGALSDHFGRRPVIIGASFLFTIGAIIMGATPNNIPKNVVEDSRYILLVGRVFVGAAIGLSSATVPAYVSETSPPHVRGRMLTMFQLLITFGFWVAGLLDAGFSYLPSSISWKLMLGIAGVPSLVQFIGFFFMPESPRWLATHGREDDAMKVLRRVTSSQEVANYELKNIIHSHEEAERELRARGGSLALITMLTTPKLRRALIVGCAMQMFQQLCGINTVMYYSTTIVIMSGVRDTTTAIWFSSITSGFNFFCTFIGIYLVERVGRRILTLGSTACVFFCLILLGVGFTIIQKTGPSEATEFKASYAALNLNLTCDYSCSYHTDCGFCYNFNSSLTNNEGVCMTVNGTDDSYSNAGTPCATDGGSNGPIFAHGWCPTPYSWLPVLAMVVYLCSFSCGLGPMPWTMNAEIYPHWARSTGNACATAVNWAFNLIISLTFLTLSTAITRQGAFFLYAGITGIGWVVFWAIVPETKNKELEELEDLFAKPWFGSDGKNVKELGETEMHDFKL